MSCFGMDFLGTGIIVDIFQRVYRYKMLVYGGLEEVSKHANELISTKQKKKKKTRKKERKRKKKGRPASVFRSVCRSVCPKKKPKKKPTHTKNDRKK